ncbi:sensor histidine kinase [Microbispora hainanensis]|uniref:sensor histidine kinase n=1 Tax=Microbispora hainanensis TaxID=568844 RepID=UPI00142F01F1|nr:histidine kinase [Microbispora hainanensis]
MQGRFARAVKAGVYLLLGAALLTPAAVALGLLILAEPTPARVLVLWATCLPASVLLAAMPLMRRLEKAALSELLGIEVPARADRLYLIVLTSLHLHGGATLGAGVLLLSPGLVRLGDAARWRAAPGELVEVAVLTVAVLTAMVAGGLGQRWAARRLLRAEPSRVIEKFGHRQSLVLELHDSVGHALSVVLVQAMAAQAALRASRAPEADASLGHLVSTARDAQQDLDVLLRVLDDDGAAQAPTLDSLGALIGGLDVRASVGRLHRVPAASSRAAFAITREALTNALRHGEGPITIDIATGDDLVVTVENRTVTGVASRPGAEGRGLAGMRMRARLAGGKCVQKEVDGRWCVQATLPL